MIQLWVQDLFPLQLLLSLMINHNQSLHLLFELLYSFYIDLMDFWMVETVREIRDEVAVGLPPPPHSSDFEIGCHLFDFLFAAQDASTSSLVWAIVLTESHPEILSKLCEERTRLRRGDIMAPFTPESLREMKYTEMVVKEVLRYRPPATLVPHIASTDIALTDTYTIPKGTIMFPSLLESSFQGFTDPYEFDPERFSPERKENSSYTKTCPWRRQRLLIL
jgi:cytochrome P450 family 710 subfamily A protein